MTTLDRIREIQDPARREHFVYRIYDGAGVLLYVGCTNHLERRWTEHRSTNRGMTAQARRLKVSGPYNYDTARRLEAEALTNEFPKFGMTPQRRAAATRNAVLNRRYLGMYLDSGYSPEEASAHAAERSELECPRPHVTRKMA